MHPPAPINSIAPNAHAQTHDVADARTSRIHARQCIRNNVGLEARFVHDQHAQSLAFDGCIRLAFPAGDCDDDGIMTHRPRSIRCFAFACLGVAIALSPAHADEPDAASVLVARSSRPMGWRELDVGRLAPALHGKTLDGQPWSLDSAQGASAVVIAMTSSTCPVSRKYAPTLGRIEALYRDRSVMFVYVNASTGDEPADISRQIAEHALHGQCLMDADREIAAALRARTTAEVIVLDSARTIIYRGAIDDQYSLGASLDAPRSNWLIDAIDAALAGRMPSVRATTVTGCAIEPADSTTQGRPHAVAVNWHNRISRIIAENCLECHRSGGVAPFAFETAAQVRSRSNMIRFAVEQNLMPPWFAAPQPDLPHSPWLNDRSLSEADRRDLLSWLSSADKPDGDPADAPLARTFPLEWSIGEPDAVIQIPEPIAVKADGIMPYIHVRVDAGFDEDRWIQAVEVLPTAREVVHHVLVFAVPRGSAAREARDMIDETRGFFAAYVPGNSAAIFPEGFARKLPKDSSLIFQLHYTPNGMATTDQTRIGLKFTSPQSTPPKREMLVAGVANQRLNIPPGSADHRELASIDVPWDVNIVAFMPHMHVRGKAFRYDIIDPAGVSRTALDVPRYDFNWQLRYEFREPMKVAAGSKINVTAWYDNSEANPANPDPASRVRWGPQTTDEMLIGYVEYFVDAADAAELGEADGRGRRDLARADRFAQLLRLLDRNNDGVITRDEVPPRFMERFESLDRNGDGRVTDDEVP